MNIFSQLQQGDSAYWNDDPFTDSNNVNYTSVGYSLTYELRGPASLTLNAVADGQGWRTTLNTTSSSTLTPGLYSWAAYIKATGVRITAGSGELTVSADLSAVSGVFDGRSAAEIALAAAESALATFKSTSGLVKSYTIGGRTMQFQDATQILGIISYWRGRVLNEQHTKSIKNGLGDPRRLLVRFSK